MVKRLQKLSVKCAAPQCIRLGDKTAHCQTNNTKESSKGFFRVVKSEVGRTCNKGKTLPPQGDGVGLRLFS